MVSSRLYVAVSVVVDYETTKAIGHGLLKKFYFDVIMLRSTHCKEVHYLTCVDLLTSKELVN